MIGLMCAVLLPAVAQWRWGTFAAATLAGLALLCAGIWIAYFDKPTSIVLSQADADGSYRMTEYVVAQRNWFLGASALFLMLAVLLVLQDRFGRFRAPRFIALTFWSFCLAGLGNVWVNQIFAAALMPRRYVDYGPFFERINVVASALSSIAWLCLFALVAFVAVSLAARIIQLSN